MRLTDIAGISPYLATELERDGWTIEAVATTTPKKLTSYSGVGMATARKIIKAVQDMVNEWLLAESAKPEPGPKVEPTKRLVEPLQMSVRVRRINE